jgi:hypothetical protein
MPAQTETVEQEDPFAVFQSAAEIIGFVHHKLKDAGLRELLAMLEGKDMSREFLKDAALELDAAGLKKPAAIVAEAAGQFPPEISLNPHAPNSPEWHKWQKLRLKLENIRQRQRKTKASDMYARLRSPTKQK